MSKSVREAARLEASFVSLLSAWKMGAQEVASVAAERDRLRNEREEVGLLLDELQHIEVDAPLFKLVGPVMQPQSRAEVMKASEKRMAMLEEEMQRVERREKALVQQQREKRLQLAELQKQLPNIPNSIYNV